MALVPKCGWVLMPNKAIKGPVQQQAGVRLNPVTLLWEVYKTKILYKWSQVTPLLMNELGQYMPILQNQELVTA